MNIVDIKSPGFFFDCLWNEVIAKNIEKGLRGALANFQCDVDCNCYARLGLTFEFGQALEVVSMPLVCLGVAGFESCVYLIRIGANTPVDW